MPTCQSLWPPDHKMLPVHILGVVMPSDNGITINNVTQDEPTNGLGDGDTPIDAIIHHYRRIKTTSISVPNVPVRATDAFTRSHSLVPDP